MTWAQSLGYNSRGGGVRWAQSLGYNSRGMRWVQSLGHNSRGDEMGPESRL